jgi:hypothetical protein
MAFASSAMSAGLAASTTMSMASGFVACAADTHFAVAERLSLPLRCSAMTRILLIAKMSSVFFARHPGEGRDPVTLLGCFLVQIFTVTTEKKIPARGTASRRAPG